MKNNFQDTFLYYHQESLYAPYSQGTLINEAVALLSQPFVDQNITKVIGIESRGFILGSAVAQFLGCGFIPFRKGGNTNKTDFISKYSIVRQNFVDYSGQQKSIEVEDSPHAFTDTDRFLIVEDWVATGEQLQAALIILEKINRGIPVGISVILNSLPENRKKIKVFTTYHSTHLLITRKKHEYIEKNIWGKKNSEEK